MEKMLFQKRLQQLRERAGLTQNELGQKVGVSRFTVIDWESGKRSPNVEILKKLSLPLGVSVAYLVGETDDPRPALVRHVSNTRITEESQADETEKDGELLVIPEILQGVYIASSSSGNDDWTQDEIDALANIAKIIKAKRGRL